MTDIASVLERASSANGLELDELAREVDAPDVPALLAALGDPEHAIAARFLLLRMPEVATATSVAAWLDSPYDIVRDAAAMLLVALRLVGRAERNVRLSAVPEDVMDRLAALLRFFPSPAPPWSWPETWVQAARLLGPGQLEPVARGEDRCYLTALGALNLVEAGIHSPLIDGWLEEDRDYPYLTEAELAAVKRAV